MNLRRVLMACAICTGMLAGCRGDADSHAWLRARAQFRYIPALHALVVKGRIGRDFTADLHRALARHPHTRRIVVNSPGGVTRQAWAAAELLDSRGIHIVVVGVCASACSQLWAATRRRELMPDARIGLHRSRWMGHRLPAWLHDGIARAHQRKAHRVLQRAGFPDALLRQAAPTPPEKMLWLSARRMKQAGVRFCMVRDLRTHAPCTP